MTRRVPRDDIVHARFDTGLGREEKKSRRITDPSSSWCEKRISSAEIETVATADSTACCSAAKPPTLFTKKEEASLCLCAAEEEVAAPLFFGEASTGRGARLATPPTGASSCSAARATSATTTRTGMLPRPLKSTCSVHYSAEKCVRHVLVVVIDMMI